MPTLTFQTSEHEAAIIRRAARARRMTFSAYARHMMLDAPKGGTEIKSADRIKPGRAVVATPPISREEIDAILYEY